MNEPYVGISTGCFAWVPYDIRAIVEVAAGLNCDFLELLLSPKWCNDLRLVMKSFEGLAGRIRSVHAVKATDLIAASDEALRAKARWFLEASFKFAARFGARNLTVHLWDYFSPDPMVADPNISAIQEVVDWARPWTDKGLTLSIELLPARSAPLLQVVQNFERQLPRSVAYTLDFEFAEYQHSLESLLAFASRFSNAHVKDYAGKLVSDDGKRRYCKLGHGRLDFIRIFRALHEAGFSGLYTIEVPSMSLEEAQATIDFVRERLQVVEN